MRKWRIPSGTSNCGKYTSEIGGNTQLRLGKHTSEIGANTEMRLGEHRREDCGNTGERLFMFLVSAYICILLLEIKFGAIVFDI